MDRKVMGCIAQSPDGKKGMGRIAEPCVILLYQRVLEDFEKLSKLGVMFSGGLLRQLTLKIIASGDGSLISPAARSTNSGKHISEHITRRCIQHFCDKRGIVCHTQAG